MLGCSSVVEGFPRTCKKSPGSLPSSVKFLNKLDNKVLLPPTSPKFGEREERVLTGWHQNACLALVRLTPQWPHTKCCCSFVVKDSSPSKKGGDHSISCIDTVEVYSWFFPLTWSSAAEMTACGLWSPFQVIIFPLHSKDLHLSSPCTF